MKSFLVTIIVASVLIVGVGLIAIAASPDVQTGANHLNFNGFSFSFDPALAENVNIAHFAGDPIDFEAPGGPEVPHIAYTLYSGMIPPESMLDAVGGLRVYRTADFAQYEFPAKRLAELQSVLETRPDLTTYAVQLEMSIDSITLPFMPVFPAAQVIRGQAHYVDTDSVSGIAYITGFRQAPSPIIANELLYTFQGISRDGQYYISVIMPLNSTMFPSEIPADFDYEAFIATYMDYVAQTTELLNSASPNDFEPSLTLMDDLVNSIAIEN